MGMAGFEPTPPEVMRNPALLPITPHGLKIKARINIYKYLELEQLHYSNAKFFPLYLSNTDGALGMAGALPLPLPRAILEPVRPDARAPQPRQRHDGHAERQDRVRRRLGQPAVRRQGVREQPVVRRWRDDTFFFNIRSSDLRPDGSAVANAENSSPDMVMDIRGIDPDTCFDEADETDDDGLMMRCVMAQMYAAGGSQGPELGKPYASDDGAGTFTIVNGTATAQNVSLLVYQTSKAFHSKTYPLAHLASRIYQ